MHLLGIVLSNLDSRRIEQLDGNARKVTRLQLRWLYCERKLIDEVIRLVELCRKCIGSVCSVNEVSITIRIDNLNHLSRSVCISNNGNVVTIALQLHYREGVSLVVLAEIRESFLVVLDVLLYNRPAWAVIVSYVCNRDKWEAVSFLFNASVVVDSEYLGNSLDSLLDLAFVNLLLEAVECLVIPHLYPFNLFITFLVEVVILASKHNEFTSKRVELRIQCVSSIESQCASTEFLVFIEESDYSSLSNLHVRTYSLIVANLHIVHIPSLLELGKKINILFLFLHLRITGKLKLNIVTCHVENVLRMNNLLESKCRSLNLLDIPFPVFRVLSPDVRVEILVEDFVGRRIELTKEVLLSLNHSVQCILRHLRVFIIGHLVPAIAIVGHVPLWREFKERLLYQNLSEICYLDSIHNPFTFLFFFFVKLNIIT